MVIANDRKPQSNSIFYFILLHTKKGKKVRRERIKPCARLQVLYYTRPFTVTVPRARTAKVNTVFIGISPF